MMDVRWFIKLFDRLIVRSWGNLLATFLILSFACSDKTTFEKVDCDPNYKSENHNLKKIFKPCREFYYSAKFWNTDKTLVSDEVVKITATGKDWMHQTDRQDEIVIQFQSHSISDISTIESGSINPDLKGWVE